MTLGSSTAQIIRTLSSGPGFVGKDDQNRPHRRLRFEVEREPDYSS